MSTFVLADADEARAASIARSQRFESDPVKLFDKVIDELGSTRGVAVWARACELYDEMKGAA